MEEEVIKAQLDYVSQGGGDAKFIRGDYGSGKTFLVARALEIAREKGFVTAHVVISPSAPLHKIKGLYQQICATLRTREEEHAPKSIIDTWLFGIEERILKMSDQTLPEDVLETATIAEIENALAGISELNSSFAAALRTYYRSSTRAIFKQLSLPSDGYAPSLTLAETSSRRLGYGVISTRPRRSCSSAASSGSS